MAPTNAAVVARSSRGQSVGMTSRSSLAEKKPGRPRSTSARSVGSRTTASGATPNSAHQPASLAFARPSSSRTIARLSLHSSAMRGEAIVSADITEGQRRRPFDRADPRGIRGQRVAEARERYALERHHGKGAGEQEPNGEGPARVAGGVEPVRDVGVRLRDDAAETAVRVESRLAGVQRRQVRREVEAPPPLVRERHDPVPAPPRRARRGSCPSRRSAHADPRARCSLRFGASRSCSARVRPRDPLAPARRRGVARKNFSGQQSPQFVLGTLRRIRQPDGRGGSRAGAVPRHCPEFRQVMTRNGVIPPTCVGLRTRSIPVGDATSLFATRCCGGDSRSVP